MCEYLQKYLLWYLIVYTCFVTLSVSSYPTVVIVIEGCKCVTMVIKNKPTRCRNRWCVLVEVLKLKKSILDLHEAKCFLSQLLNISVVNTFKQ